MLLFLGSAAGAPGDLDATFGSGGVTRTAIGSAAIADALTLQPDGRILLAGSAYPADGFAVVRYNADGSLDASFGSDGRAIGPQGSAVALAVQADGKILVAGAYVGGSMAVFRFTAEGSLDTAFGVAGIAAGPAGEARAVSVQPDGKIVAIGGGPDPYPGTDTDFVTLRFDADGTPDASFGSNGVVRTAIGAMSAASGMALQPDGKIVAAGWSIPNDRSVSEEMTLARYEANGALDGTFGSDGIATTRLGSFSVATALAMTPDGRLLAAGSADRGLVVTRFTAQGGVDQTFGAGGTTAIRTGGLRWAWGLALAPSGQILIAGGDTSVFTILALEPEGSLDASFGDEGITRTAVGFISEARGVAVQPDGRIVAAGFSSTQSETSFTLARYRVTTPTTIAAQPLLTPYGGQLSVSGTGVDSQPGTAVAVTARGCYAFSTKRVATTTEGSGGEWSANVAPRSRTMYRAEIGGERSVAVTVQVSPRLSIKRLTRTRVRARVLFGHSLAGETIDLERLQANGEWGRVRRGSLTRSGTTRSGVFSGATFKIGRRAAPLRAVLRQPNPYACFADGISAAIPR